MKQQKNVFYFSNKLLLIFYLFVCVSVIVMYFKTLGNKAIVVIMMIGIIHVTYKLIKLKKKGQDTRILLKTLAYYLFAIVVMVVLKRWI